MSFDYGIFVGLARLDAPITPRPPAPPPCGMQFDYKSLYRSSMGLVALLGGFRRVHRELNSLPCSFWGGYAMALLLGSLHTASRLH